MTKGQMRELLRRRLQEEIAENFDDDELDNLLNIGLHRVQLAIKRAHPDASLHRAVANIENGVDLYDFPPGFISEYLVETRDSTSSAYGKIKRVNFRDTIDRASGSETVYARTGKWIRISPTPTENVTNGLRIWFVPTLSMSADSDVPDIPLVLHEGPVIWANKVALDETGEASKEVSAEWAEFIQLIMETYNVTDADPQYISLDIDKNVF